MASVDKTSSQSLVHAQWRSTEVRSAEVRRDSARHDEDRAARRVKEAERDLERAHDRFDRYA
jgi:hypothetical protein